MGQLDGGLPVAIDAVRDWQPSVLPQRQSVWMMMTRTVLCPPVLIVPSSRELQFMSLAAVTQFTGVALMMESMLLVSSARGCARCG